MAKDVRFIHVCDPCNRLNIPHAEAITTHVISVDGGPLKEVDVCARDEELFQQFVQTFLDGAREAPQPEPEPKPVKKRKPRAVKAAKPKELPPPPDDAETPAVQKKPKPVVWCPLPHPAKKGAGSIVTYEDSNSHADVVHDRTRIWEIQWGDPENILNFPCDTHAECMKTNLAFTTSRGLTQHRISCPLPRIDQPSERQEGDPQNSDEPAP